MCLGSQSRPCPTMDETTGFDHPQSKLKHLLQQLQPKALVLKQALPHAHTHTETADVMRCGSVTHIVLSKDTAVANARGQASSPEKGFRFSRALLYDFKASAYCCASEVCCCVFGTRAFAASEAVSVVVVGLQDSSVWLIGCWPCKGSFMNECEP